MSAINTMMNLSRYGLHTWFIRSMKTVEGVNRYADLATGVAPGIKSMRNSTSQGGANPDRNKAWLIAQGYNQQEGIDLDETYASVARLESLRILLAYACANDFKLFQMDVKSAFLNGFINEEVYVSQPPGFVNFEKPNCVYKLKKALYGLKQAPKAWYDRLKAFLLDHKYTMGW
ncbi:copia protein [Tanacetum coccineum]